MCDGFEQVKGTQWQQTIMHYAVFEWALGVLERMTNLDDREEFIQRVDETRMADSLAGIYG